MQQGCFRAYLEKISGAKSRDAVRKEFVAAFQARDQGKKRDEDAYSRMFDEMITPLVDLRYRYPLSEPEALAVLSKELKAKGNPFKVYKHMVDDSSNFKTMQKILDRKASTRRSDPNHNSWSERVSNSNKKQEHVPRRSPPSSGPKRGQTSRGGGTRSDRRSPPSPSKRPDERRIPKSAHSNKQWSCPRCTFLNDEDRNLCYQCQTPKPHESVRAQQAAGRIGRPKLRNSSSRRSVSRNSRSHSRSKKPY